MLSLAVQTPIAAITRGEVAAVPVWVAVPAGVAPVIVAALALGPQGGMEMAVGVQVAVAMAQAGKTMAPSLQPKLVPFRSQLHWPWSCLDSSECVSCVMGNAVRQAFPELPDNKGLSLDPGFDS